MTRIVALLATLAVVLAVAVAPVAGLAPGDRAAQVDPSANETAERPAPGARLAGVVAVQAAEVESEFEARAFGVRVAAADSNRSRASVVAERVTALRERTAEIQERREALQDARENGTISRARYNAEMAALAARSNALGHQLNQTETASRGLDAELEERGVNTTAIRTLQNEARTLSGPEGADIARSIAGLGVGGGLDGRVTPPLGRPDNVSVGGDNGGVTITLGTPNGSSTPTIGPRQGNTTGTPTLPGTPGMTATPTLPITTGPGIGNGGPGVTPSTPDVVPSG